MNARTLLRAGLFGLSLALIGTGDPAAAQNLKVMRGETARSLKVPMNRAVVVESDTPFAELSVANPNIADIATLSDRSIYVLGKAPGRTTMTLLGPDGRLITNIEVHVSPDIAEFKERLRQILPGEPIEVRTANDGVVLSGTVSSIVKMDRALDLAQRYAPERVTNMMSVGGTQQVMLKVRFAEMQRSVAKNLSTSFGITGGSGTDGFTGVSGTYSQGDNPINLFTGGGVTSTRETEGTLSIGLAAGGLEFAVLMEALETKGMVRTLAEPNLTALSGQEARFLAGGEYPIPVSDGDGGITVEYKPFGVELTFIPTVLDDKVINLEMAASVSAIDSSITVTADGISVSGFSRRETKTTVEMRDGQSFAIAGLLQDDFTNLVGQVPWLGDIPVLGALFRSSDYTRQQSELVIIVTAHLVSPTQGEVLALPTDRVPIPNERDFFLNGKVVGATPPKTGPAGEVAQQDFTGSYGYVME